MKKMNTVFFVDDDVDDQEIFSLALSEVDKSIVCHTASDGLEALNLLDNGSVKPDCIFLDLNMPRMNGKQCLSEIKRQSGLKHIPVVIYTTSSEEKDMQDTAALGASDFITKPSELTVLINKLQKVLCKLDDVTGINITSLDNGKSV